MALDMGDEVACVMLLLLAGLALNVKGQIVSRLRRQRTVDPSESFSHTKADELPLVTTFHIVGPGGVLAQLTKRLVERAMSAELTEHLGYEPASGAAWRHG
jgi:hypothetical protein